MNVTLSGITRVLLPSCISPPGTAQENVSVVRSQLAPGFSLRGTLGAPTEAAERLLSTAIAPPGSGREYELISARAEQRRGAAAGAADSEVYVFEYTIKVRECKHAWVA